MLSQGDTTGSNALIGAWQKELGHQSLWEDFNLEYERGPPPSSRNERVRSRPSRASTRKSTGGIPTPRPVKKVKPLPRRRSAECHYFSDSTLTPLPSSDDEDDTLLRITNIHSQAPSSPSRSRSTAGLPPGDSSGHSVGITDRGTSPTHAPQDIDMDPGIEPPPTPPQDIGVLVDPSDYCYPASSTAPLTEFDDPMNGTSVSAMCLRSGRELSQSVVEFNDAKWLSAPVVRSSSDVRRKVRPRTNWHSKGRSKKKRRTGHVEETIDQSMIIDTPAVIDPEPESEQLTIVHQDTALGEPFIPELEPSEPPPLKISIHPSLFIPPIAPEIRVPLSTSFINIPLPRPVSASNVDPSLDGLKGSNSTSVAAVPGFSRPALPNNPPIWAQVKICS